MRSYTNTMRPQENLLAQYMGLYISAIKSENPRKFINLMWELYKDSLFYFFNQHKMERNDTMFESL
jgi:hypothetical protein